MTVQYFWTQRSIRSSSRSQNASRNSSFGIVCRHCLYSSMTRKLFFAALKTLVLPCTWAFVSSVILGFSQPWHLLQCLVASWTQLFFLGIWTPLTRALVQITFLEENTLGNSFLGFLPRISHTLAVSKAASTLSAGSLTLLLTLDAFLGDFLPGFFSHTHCLHTLLLALYDLDRVVEPRFSILLTLLPPLLGDDVSPSIFLTETSCRCHLLPGNLQLKEVAEHALSSRQFFPGLLLSLWA